ncbi:hypothetical protein [Acinetobacter venetianus]|uniref:DUF2946 domain-containing protein n=1 Tax=Acinetobacter venetianus TaxID=52133 RepID=A0A150HVL8_9GAMM|nr:hypothetical protein [Acinetobacter venetianus]KXZ71030.1 hypothetical protein AVENLUH13518_01475 [Acinetobacter venetianus]
MQLQPKYKHIWFVFLMIFFIGGSSAAVAAVHTIQADEQMEVMSQQMPCHDQAKTDQHHHMPISHVDAQMMVKCHGDSMSDDQHCQDCNQPSHCQNVNLALDQQVPTLSLTSIFELNHRTNTDYQARHLAGYWQEILRPPKA